MFCDINVPDEFITNMEFKKILGDILNILAIASITKLGVTEITQHITNKPDILHAKLTSLSRRNFLKLAGASVITALAGKRLRTPEIAFRDLDKKALLYSPQVSPEARQAVEMYGAISMYYPNDLTGFFRNLYWAIQMIDYQETHPNKDILHLVGFAHQGIERFYTYGVKHGVDKLHTLMLMHPSLPKLVENNGGAEIFSSFRIIKPSELDNGCTVPPEDDTFHTNNRLYDNLSQTDYEKNPDLWEAISNNVPLYLQRNN